MDITETLQRHKLFLAGDPKGVCANLTGANLTGANLSGVNLTGANLTGAYLSGAYLIGTYLSGANLSGANLGNADLRAAYLSGANLSGANLGNADFRSADLSCAEGIVSFGPVGEKRRFGYAVTHQGGPRVQLGCFWGTLEEARAAILKKYGPNSTYERLVVAACDVLSETN